MKGVKSKEARERLEAFNLACELKKAISHFFPDKLVEDPRNQSYITYESQIILMTRILSSIFYISSMRKTSEEFNN